MLEFGTSTTIILMTHIKQALLLFLYKKIIKLDCVELNKEIGNFLSVVGSDLEFLENSCVFLRLPTFPIF